ncbi:IS3 family transposase [Streptomyces sp. NPDC057565]|uniref:IS3 family transposase n=1 Tax=Streptomyces sp. NPDC057565 TaxID=3346169 RepID=UPI0036B3AA84
MLIKVEYIHRNQFATRAETRLKIATWITDFYNPRRRHSEVAALPPIKFERTISEARACSPAPASPRPRRSRSPELLRPRRPTSRRTT